MITLKPIVIPSNRRSDGSYRVYMRLYYAGRSRRIPTNIFCRASDLTRGLRIKGQEVLKAATRRADQILAIIAAIPDGELAGKDVDWVLARIDAAERARDFRLDFFQFADSLISAKSPGARCQYVTACHTFAEYLGTRSLDINDITKQMIGGYVEWLHGKAFSFRFGTLSRSDRGRIPGGAESRNVAKLAHIFDAAKKRFNDEDEGVILIPRSPFQGMRTPHPPSHGQRSLGVELMQRVILASHPLGTVQAALDLFVLSFATMGANLADLYEIDSVKKLREAGRWEYQRRKTRKRRPDGAQMLVTLPEEIYGRLDAVAALHRIAGKPQYATAKINKGLARWCADNDIPVFTFYAARHTWATLARKAGVEKATIDEGLCHIGDFPVADIYAERDWDLINGANRRVLALFSWP